MYEAKHEPYSIPMKFLDFAYANHVVAVVEAEDGQIHGLLLLL